MIVSIFLFGGFPLHHALALTILLISWKQLINVGTIQLLLDVRDPEMELTKERAKRDRDVAIELKLKSWNGKKVHGILPCYICGKRRCVYIPAVIDFTQLAELALQQKLESVSESYSCADLLFHDDHPLGKKNVQRQSFTFMSPMITTRVGR